MTTPVLLVYFSVTTRVASSRTRFPKAQRGKGTSTGGWS